MIIARRAKLCSIEVVIGNPGRRGVVHHELKPFLPSHSSSRVPIQPRYIIPVVHGIDVSRGRSISARAAAEHRPVRRSIRSPANSRALKPARNHTRDPRIADFVALPSPPRGFFCRIFRPLFAVPSSSAAIPPPTPPPPPPPPPSPPILFLLLSSM